MNQFVKIDNYTHKIERWKKRIEDCSRHNNQLTKLAIEVANQIFRVELHFISWSAFQRNSIWHPLSSSRLFTFFFAILLTIHSFIYKFTSTKSWSMTNLEVFFIHFCCLWNFFGTKLHFFSKITHKNWRNSYKVKNHHQWSAAYVWRYPSLRGKELRTSHSNVIISSDIYNSNNDILYKY